MLLYLCINYELVVFLKRKKKEENKKNNSADRLSEMSKCEKEIKAENNGIMSSLSVCTLSVVAKASH